jgi:uncharacterized protein (TIGR00159 family)
MQFLKTFTSLLQNIGIRDVLDIAIVSLAFFLLFTLLRVSRSYLALRSLILLLSTTVAIYVTAQIFEFSGVVLLFGQFWVVIIIIYLLIFQNSFRRAFQELGQIRLVRALIKPESTYFRTLAKAVMRLSEKQLGALFVLPRRTDIFPSLISPGIEIDSVISEDLIVTLFFSYTPLHDGAVIIENDRISHANVTLPISKTTDVPRGLGTRHRAAIEITEISDCITIVVSEETGTVSLVQGGVIERGLDEDGLLKALEKAMNINLKKEKDASTEKV